LRNIFKELENEYGVKRTETDLTDWAEQGVLLLNTALTVRESSAGSHLKFWKPFTWDVVKHIATKTKNTVYVLWGAHAQEYESLIDKENNLVLRGIHPSPLAARAGNFVGNGHFQKANEYLVKFDKAPITWVSQDVGRRNQQVEKGAT
jgi:uracil-DNA glycosylase